MNPIEAVVSTFAIILFVAFLVESLIEYLLGVPFDKVESLVPYKWTLMYAGALAGVGMAFVYNFDLISLLGQFLNVDIVSSPAGSVVTGLAIGRGAGYLNDLASKFFASPPAPTA